MGRRSVAARAPADRVEALAGDERGHAERRDTARAGAGAAVSISATASDAIVRE